MAAVRFSIWVTVGPDGIRNKHSQRLQAMLWGLAFLADKDISKLASGNSLLQAKLLEKGSIQGR
jgi:hypothetical protein